MPVTVHTHQRGLKDKGLHTSLFPVCRAGSCTKATWDWREEPLKPSLEASCRVPGTQGVDTLPLLSL